MSKKYKPAAPAPQDPRVKIAALHVELASSSAKWQLTNEKAAIQPLGSTVNEPTGGAVSQQFWGAA